MSNQPTDINVDQGWFLAQKTAAIRAKKLETDCRIKTLEGKLCFKAGMILCKGSFNDLWAQQEAQFQKKFVCISPSQDQDGWKEYAPVPEQCRVWAKQMDHDFIVETVHGTLYGNKGDYWIKQWTPIYTSDLPKQWIVKQTIFEKTYEKL